MQLFRHTRPKGPVIVPVTFQKSHLEPNSKVSLESKPRILVIGAGYRGYPYAELIHSSGEGIIAAVAEPSEFKRRAFGEIIWGQPPPSYVTEACSTSDIVTCEVLGERIHQCTFDSHKVMPRHRFSSLTSLFVDFCIQPRTTSSPFKSDFFRQSNKPSGAGAATNCLSCSVETTCQYRAKSLYLHQQLRAGNSDRPANAIVPDIEDVLRKRGLSFAAKRLLEVRNWYGRCVWESDNDVCDDQMITIEWEDELLPLPQCQKNRPNRSSLSSKQQLCAGNLGTEPRYRPAKVVQFLMVAVADAISKRFGRISGTTGEIVYDAATIRVNDFHSGSEVVYNIPTTKRCHHGGDDGLALSFVRVVAKVKRGEMGVLEAQRTFLNCTVEELLRSHLAVFWVEEARIGGTTVKWQ
ncbi:uncharacterized protein ATNIH1004_002828 [Aspergillus tanneri]|uniref:FAD/NAD(P)-binding domain-containing protein n=1 Tax=Aspergillus tanneri TaxID=1220188 RepID=A0A5M9N6C7_9EURO|nr:uncharacterized protein ATNIH1004_002828 [Aspergillus tanneri]KAA8650147.1 hypothetical protein ATNIH1004_002828 [Aspergillus tanneri]